MFLSRLKGIFDDIELRALVLSDAPPGAPQGDFSPEGLHASFNNPLAATKDASTAASAFQTLKVRMNTKHFNRHNSQAVASFLVTIQYL